MPKFVLSTIVLLVFSCGLSMAAENCPYPSIIEVNLNHKTSEN